MMAIKPIAAIITVIALISVTAAVAATVNQASAAQTASNAAAFQGVNVVANFGAFDPYGPAGHPLPPEQSRVIISPDPQSGFQITGSGGTYTACWTLTNTGTKGMRVQPYVVINGWLYVLNRPVMIGPGQTLTRCQTFYGITELPGTVYVNVREFRSNSASFWVAYDQNQPVILSDS